MQVILSKDVDNLGLEFDLVNVKPGYARNYLIPQGLAFLATPKNKEKLEETLKQKTAEEAAIIKVAQDKLTALKDKNITIEAKTGAGDKLFGAVNNHHLEEAFEKLGVSIDKKYIKVPGNSIKRLGKYVAKVRLHRDAEADIEFEVIQDAESKAKAAKANTSKAAPKKVEKIIEEEIAPAIENSSEE